MGRQLYAGIYDYSSLPIKFDEKEKDLYYKSLMLRFSLLTKNWSDELNTEWITRNYLAAKMVLSSTVMLNSVYYAKENNLKIVEPYLMYYALFSCCRAVVLTLPESQWKDGKLFEEAHSKVINIASDAIEKLNKRHGEDVKSTLQRAKDYRELFSYKFPSSGTVSLPPTVSVSIEEVVDLCQILVEVSEFQSECFYQSFKKNCKNKEFGLVQERLMELVQYTTTNGESFFDEDDYYRVGKLAFKGKTPASIYLTLSAGMVEDFFGSWADHETSDPTVFDPDQNTNIIYDFP